MTESITRQEYCALALHDKLKFWIDMPRGTVLHRSWDPLPWDHYVREVCGLALGEIRLLRRALRPVQPIDWKNAPEYTLKDGTTTNDMFAYFADLEGVTVEEAVERLARLAGLLPEKKP